MSTVVQEPPSTAGVEEADDAERTRFLLELEFVQCLANTNYLLCRPPYLV